MANFIKSADSKIKINEDVSYLLNDALHVNALFTASDVVTADKPALRVNLPNVGKNAELRWYDRSSTNADTVAAKVTNTVSTVDGSHDITISLTENTTPSRVCHIEGWIKLP